jgi:hypothetical protein
LPLESRGLAECNFQVHLFQMLIYKNVVAYIDRKRSLHSAKWEKWLKINFLARRRR